jgi:hypothetical protein
MRPATAVDCDLMTVAVVAAAFDTFLSLLLLLLRL